MAPKRTRAVGHVASSRGVHFRHARGTAGAPTRDGRAQVSFFSTLTLTLTRDGRTQVSFFFAHIDSDSIRGIVEDAYENPEHFFEEQRERDDAWCCECAPGAHIPADDREDYLEARREARRAELRAADERREAAFDERVQEVQSYPWARTLAAKRASQEEC